MYSDVSTSKSRKRGRDEDDDESLHGFSEHRRIIKARDNTKRSSIAADFIFQNQVTSSLAIRPLPNSPPRPRSNAMSHPRRFEITPNGSDNEDHPNIGWVKSDSSSRSYPCFLTEQDRSQDSYSSLAGCPTSQGLQVQDSMDIDEDMDDGPQFSQYPHGDLSFSHSGRIPTPITGHFSSHIRTSNRGLPIKEATTKLKFDRRLPSPISEDESVSNTQVSHVVDTLMEVETLESPRSGPEHDVRVKHSVSNMGHVSTGMGNRCGNNTKKLSMGYRSDCEKCRQRVPGHYMHLVS